MIVFYLYHIFYSTFTSFIRVFHFRITSMAFLFFIFLFKLYFSPLFLYRLSPIYQFIFILYLSFDCRSVCVYIFVLIKLKHIICAQYQHYISPLLPLKCITTCFGYALKGYNALWMSSERAQCPIILRHAANEMILKLKIRWKKRRNEDTSSIHIHIDGIESVPVSSAPHQVANVAGVAQNMLQSHSTPKIQS